MSVGPPLTMTTTGAVPYGDRHQSGGREDGQGRAHGQQQVARRRRLLRPEQVLGHQALAEADGGRLQDPAADAADALVDDCRTGRVRLAGPHPLVHRLGRLTVTAAQADHLERRAVDLYDPVGIAARLLVQPVDVLRHQQVQPRRCAPGRPGPGVPRSAAADHRGRGQAVLPRPTPAARGQRRRRRASPSSRPRGSSSTGPADHGSRRCPSPSRSRPRSAPPPAAPARAGTGPARCRPRRPRSRLRR